MATKSIADEIDRKLYHLLDHAEGMSRTVGGKEWRELERRIAFARAQSYSMLTPAEKNAIEQPTREPDA